MVTMFIVNMTHVYIILNLTLLYSYHWHYLDEILMFDINVEFSPVCSQFMYVTGVRNCWFIAWCFRIPGFNGEKNYKLQTKKKKYISILMNSFWWNEKHALLWHVPHQFFVQPFLYIFKYESDSVVLTALQEWHNDSDGSKTEIIYCYDLCTFLPNNYRDLHP